MLFARMFKQNIVLKNKKFLFFTCIRQAKKKGNGNERREHFYSGIARKKKSARDFFDNLDPVMQKGANQHFVKMEEIISVEPYSMFPLICNKEPKIRAHSATQKAIDSCDRELIFDRIQSQLDLCCIFFISFTPYINNVQCELDNYLQIHNLHNDF